MGGWTVSFARVIFDTFIFVCDNIICSHIASYYFSYVTYSYYPYGQYVVCDPDVDSGCRAPCDAAPGCEQYYSTHTCSILHFCPLSNNTATEAVYELPDFASTDSCDFSDAVSIGEMNGANSDSDGCFQYAFEEDHELREYFFASKEGCADGQKIAVKVQDFSMTADQCIKIGLTTPRIRKATLI